jgi:hypothetical protein
MRSKLARAIGLSVIGLAAWVTGLPEAQAKLPQARRAAPPPPAAATAPQPAPASVPTTAPAPPPPAALDPSIAPTAAASPEPPPATLSYPPLAPSDSTALPLTDPPAMVLSDPAAMEDSQPSGRANGEPRKFGAMFDLGVPDGTMLSFVYRPVSVARLHAGAGYNGVSPGLRLGAALLPFGDGPSISLDYGHYFEGDANGLASLVGSKDENVLLERVGYDFVNLRAGIELGGDRFTFFTRGGISWIRTTIHEFESLLTPGDEPNNGNTSISVKQDPILSAFVPSLQLGLIVQL